MPGWPGGGGRGSVKLNAISSDLCFRWCSTTQKCHIILRSLNNVITFSDPS